jgi:DNA ligase-1
MWRIINASNGLDKLLNIRAVQTLEVYDLETANIVYKRFLELGYEGAILRNKQGLYSTNRRSNDLQKLKPTLDGEFKIVGGYRVDTGREEGTCVFTCITEEGKEFDVRPKGTVSRRQDYWKKLDSLKGKMLTCQFQEWTAEKKPFHARGVAIRDYE